MRILKAESKIYLERNKLKEQGIYGDLVSLISYPSDRLSFTMKTMIMRCVPLYISGRFNSIISVAELK